MARRVVLVFTKPALPGRVKTRLIGPLSAGEAAQLHGAFVEDLLQRLEGGDYELWMAWALEEEESLPQGSLRALRQRGQDLGERMFNALSEAAASASVVCAVGTDLPELSRSHVERAFETIEAGGADVVLGPASDGGYYLIAIERQALSIGLFEDVPWSTEQVFERTVERCDHLGLRWKQLSMVSDVDTPSDLEELASKVATGAVDAPRTTALLRAWSRRAPEESR